MDKQIRLYTRRKLKIVDFTLDDARLKARCPLDNDQEDSAQSRYSVGQLDALPLELITNILLELDLPTLTTFRRVNRRAMGLVNSLHQYMMVLKHCPNVLRAIISINATGFTCMGLYNVLSDTKCEACPRFGPYLYLITCKRVCYCCFTRKIEYLPISVAHAAKYTGLSRKKIARQIPCVLSLPGRYTASAKIERKRHLLFDRRAVLNRASGTSIQGMRQQDLRTRETLRHISIISAPYFDSSGQSADWGFYCVGCVESEESSSISRTKFTRDGILDHFERFGAVTIVDKRATHG